MKGPCIYSLYSGSTGNSFLISSGKTAILIDAGKNAKRLTQAILDAGFFPEDISAIFVTHEHSDHISALPVFLKKHPVPVHIRSTSAYRLVREPSVEPHLCTHPPIDTVRVGDITVTSFPTPHDSQGSVGYRIELGEDEQSITVGYATDCGYVTASIEEGLFGCDAVILESNHDPEMLHYGPYPPDLKARIASRHGHLSNGDCAALAARLCETGTKALMLAHLSQENNTPELALRECLSALGREDIIPVVADPECVTRLYPKEDAV